MKKFILILIFINSYNSYSQYFEGYIIKNNNDTLKCKFVGISNLFYKKIFNPVPLRNKVIIQTEKEEEIKFKPSEIKSFAIKGTGRGKGDFIKFVSTELDNYKHFYHLNIEGKISQYIIYDNDMRANELRSEFYVKNSKKIKISFFSTRKDIGNLIIDYPELYNKWMNNENYKLSQENDVILEYNEYFKQH